MDGRYGIVQVKVDVRGLESSTLDFVYVEDGATFTRVGDEDRSAVVNADYASTFAVKAAGSNGTGMRNVEVTFSIETSGANTAGGTFANGQSSMTDTTGQSGEATSSTLTANGYAGEFTVRASAPGFSDVTFTATNGYDQNTLPTITKVNPLTGPLKGGTIVTITGTNFVADDVAGTTVTFGNDAGIVDAVSETEIIVRTPAKSVTGKVDIRATTANGAVTATDQFDYQNLASPTVSDIDPPAGPMSGNTLVTITGTGFIEDDLKNTSVTFDGDEGRVTEVTETSVKVHTPRHSAGLVDVVVTTSADSITITDGFLYAQGPTLTSVVPDRGTYQGGTEVIVTGTFLDPGGFHRTVVAFGENEIPGTVISWSNTSLRVTTPAIPIEDVGEYHVLVSTPGGDTALSNAYVFHKPPTLTARSPATSAHSGGQTLTLTGTGFSSGYTSASVGAANVAVASVTVNSATELQFTIPSAADAGVTGAYGYADVTVDVAKPAAVTDWADFVFGTSNALRLLYVEDGASMVKVSGDNQIAIVETAYGAPFVVKVTDPEGAGIEGVPVTFSAPGTPASGTFAGAASVTVNTDASGVASSGTFTANDTAGSVTVTASAAGFDDLTFTATNIVDPGDPTIVSFTPKFGPTDGGRS